MITKLLTFYTIWGVTTVLQCLILAKLLIHNEKKCNDTMHPQDARAIVSCFSHVLGEVRS